MATRYVIAHRGASGSHLENTIASFEKAIELGAQALELDVQLTADGVFVVCHDDDISRVSESSERISSLEYKDLAVIALHEGHAVPMLTQVLDLARAHATPVIVEVKTSLGTEALCELLDGYADLDLTVASFKHDLIARIRELRPDMRLYLTEMHRPIEVLQKARAIKAQGIDINYMLMNPVTYWLAGRWNMEIMVYTVDHAWIGKALHFFYPNVRICTNYPERFLPKKKNRRSAKRRDSAIA